MHVSNGCATGGAPQERETRGENPEIGEETGHADRCRTQLPQFGGPYAQRLASARNREG